MNAEVNHQMSTQVQALIEKWRKRADAELACGNEPCALPGMKRAVGRGIAAIYYQCAGELEAALLSLPEIQNEQE